VGPRGATNVTGTDAWAGRSGGGGGAPGAAPRGATNVTGTDAQPGRAAGGEGVEAPGLTARVSDTPWGTATESRVPGASAGGGVVVGTLTPALETPIRADATAPSVRNGAGIEASPVAPQVVDGTGSADAFMRGQNKGRLFGDNGPRRGRAALTRTAGTQQRVQRGGVMTTLLAGAWLPGTADRAVEEALNVRTNRRSAAPGEARVMAVPSVA